MDCERCSNYNYDDELGDYVCDAPFDQDSMERMMYGDKKCQFYIENAEYRSAGRQ